MQQDNLTISVAEAAKLLSMNPQQLREGIENGSFSFGIFLKSAKGIKIYKVSRKKLYDFLGFENQKNEEDMTLIKTNVKGSNYARY